MTTYTYDNGYTVEFDDDYSEYISKPDNPLAQAFADYVWADAKDWNCYPDDDPRSTDFEAWAQDGEVGTAFLNEDVAGGHRVYKIYKNADHTDVAIIFFEDDVVWFY